MNYRLGLDLGTNSIGWAIYSLDNEKEPQNLIDMGVRIFSDGRDPKTKEPLAVARRTARGQRKSIYRRKLRRRAAFRLLQSQGLLPKDKDEARKLKLLNPYLLRIKALDEKLEPYELGRALFNLAVRRGFKSNRKDAENEETAESKSTGKKLSQKEMCTELSKAISESGCRTLGEFLWKKQEEHNGIRFVPGRMSYYPLRQMYVDEFNAIRAKQETIYKTVDWQAISDALFFQRPLKPQQRGKCQYMPDKERTFKAMPCAQKIRMLQEVRNMYYQNALGQKIPIGEDEEKIILELLDTKDKATFDAFRKALKLDASCTFNLESENRTFLNGNTTAVKLRNKNRFGALWDELPLEEQDFIVETLITADEDKQVLELLAKYQLSDEQKDAIVKVVLPSGTTMLCKEVSEQIVNKMIKTGCSYTEVVQSLGYKYADQSVEKCDLLPYYGKVLVGSTMGGDASKPESLPEQKYGKISNPTVHVALNQTRVVVNALIKQYGKPAQIVIELSRDLKASREAKDAMMRKQNENKKRNESLNKNIADAYKIEYPNRNDRLKFRLWEELGSDTKSRKCLYCGKNISGSELFSKNIEIEHILPYSRTLLDAESNLTVAHASCNAFKRERSPYEAFGTNPSGYNWQEILNRANQLKNPAKRSRFAIDAMETFEKESSFIARQLTDNAYLSKTARKYLHAVCDDIWSVNGGMTKLLRDKWEIDSILKRKIGTQEIAHFGLKEEQIGQYKKNRYDHRHHALDASVIALIDRSMVQQISTLNAKSQKNRIEVPPMAVARLELEEKVKNIVVSFKPDHGAEGKLSKETLLGKIKREELVDIAKIEESDIPLIKSDKVRSDFESGMAELKDIKAVRKALKDVYPQVKVYREFFVSRTAVTSLKENNINDIVDARIRSLIRNFIDLHKGEKIEYVLQKFTETKHNGKYIKKVRCMNRVQTPIIINDKIPRYLAPEDYFAAVIWQLPPKKEWAKPTYEAQYIRRNEVGKDNKPKPDCLKAPHPAAKNLGILHKNDYLEFSDNGNWYKCRVAGFSATDNKLVIMPIYAATSSTEYSNWIIATADFMLEPCWKVKDGRNVISVNVLFGEKQARFITVNPIGKVFRK